MPAGAGSNAAEGPAHQRAWWNRPCGGFEVLAIATPLVMSTISWTLMQFIDRTFLMWYSTDAMAAAMPAGCVNFTAICLAMGIASYAGTFVAQYHGAGRHENIGPIVWQGIWIGLACMPLFLLLGLFAPQIFFSVGHTPNIAGLETVYFRRLAWGSAAVVVSAAAAGFFSGRGKTTVIMQVSVVAALLNIGLDYLWIFGHAGFPVGGIAGAGMATSVSEWAKAAIYLGLMFGTDPSRKFGVRDGMRIDAGLMRSLFRFGGPNGLQMFVEMAAFSAYLLLVGQLGPTELAATTLAFNINQIAFVPLFGLGMAASILVGNQIGRKRVDLAERATWTTLVVALAYSSVMALLYWLFPDAFLVLHKMGADAEEFQRIRDTTVVLLRFVAAYCVIDAIQIVFSSSIKGAGDTRFVLVATLILSPIPVLLGWSGIRYANWGLMHFWILVTVWIIAQSVIYLGRFLQGAWRTMNVIDGAKLS